MRWLKPTGANASANKPAPTQGETKTLNRWKKQQRTKKEAEKR